ncbi:MAG: hypothetical protein MI921_09350 [Cytophagales bacterium]|nr:hypothetical protein [Cytophagales bacterium]
MTVSILDLNQKEVFSKTYKSVNLEGGRTVKALQPFRPDHLGQGYYYIVYEIK